MKPTTNVKKTIGVSLSDEARILKSIETMGGRAPTWMISMDMATKTPRVLKICKAMAKDGKIKKWELSQSNNYIWEKA